MLVHPLGPFIPVPANAAMAILETMEVSPTPAALVPLATVSEPTQPIEAQTHAWCLEDIRQRGAKTVCLRGGQ